MLKYLLQETLSNYPFHCAIYANFFLKKTLESKYRTDTF